MDINKTINSIEFKNFSDLINATIVLISQAYDNQIKITESHYKIYETKILSTNKFQDDQIDNVRSLLRNQFSYLQSIIDTSLDSANVDKNKELNIQIVQGGISSMEELIEKGLMTEEEADIKTIDPPEWVAELNKMAEKHKDIK